MFNKSTTKIHHRDSLQEERLLWEVSMVSFMYSIVVSIRRNVRKARWPFIFGNVMFCCEFILNTDQISVVIKLNELCLATRQAAWLVNPPQLHLSLRAGRILPANKLKTADILHFHPFDLWILPSNMWPWKQIIIFFIGLGDRQNWVLWSLPSNKWACLLCDNFLLACGAEEKLWSGSLSLTTHNWNYIAHVD